MALTLLPFSFERKNFNFNAHGVHFIHPNFIIGNVPYGTHGQHVIDQRVVTSPICTHNALSASPDRCFLLDVRLSPEIVPLFVRWYDSDDDVRGNPKAKCDVSVSIRWNLALPTCDYQPPSIANVRIRIFPVYRRGQFW